VNHTVDITKLLPPNSKYFNEQGKWMVQSDDPDILASGDDLETAIQNYWIQWGMDTYEKLIAVKTDKDHELEDYKRSLRFIALSYIELSQDKAAYQRDDFVKRARQTLDKYSKIYRSPPVGIIERDF